MSKPLVDLPDAERAVIEILEGVGHAIVKTAYPSESLSGTTYWLQVDQEPGDVSDYPVLERAQVRVTAHVAYGRETAAKRLISDVIADLYTYPGNASVSAIFPRGGRSSTSTDPTTKNEMCWALFRVDLLASTATP